MLEIPQFEQEVLIIDPGSSLQFKVESQRHTYLIILEGRGTATIESLTIDLDAGNAIPVVPYSQASIENRSVSKMKVLRMLLKINKKKA